MAVKENTSVKNSNIELRQETHLEVVDEDLPEAVGQHVLGGLVGAVTDVGHLVHSLETTTNPVVDTLGATPVPLHLSVAITLKIKKRHITRVLHINFSLHGGSVNKSHTEVKTL